MQKLFPKLTVGLILFSLLSIIQSCSYDSNNILFKTPKKIKSSKPISSFNPQGDQIDVPKHLYYHRIKPGDRILINFLNNYDIGAAGGQSATSTANLGDLSLKGYLVNYDSSITLPLIGRTNLVGLSRLEAAKKLEQEYGKYVINPIIEVNIASLSVTILGEVLAPGKILIDKENTSIIDVIALCGGLKDSGKKNRIKIIRGSQVILVDLKKIESLYESAIILHDGDIIYVEPYAFKARTEPVAALQATSFIILTFTQLTLITIQILNLTKNY